MAQAYVNQVSSQFSTSTVTYRSIFFCVKVISSTLPVRSGNKEICYGTIRLKWKTDLIKDRIEGVWGMERFCTETVGKPDLNSISHVKYLVRSGVAIIQGGSRCCALYLSSGN